MEPRIATCKMWFGEACCKPEPRQLEVHFVNVDYNHCYFDPFLVSDRLQQCCCQIQKYYPCFTHGENKISPLSLCDLDCGASQKIKNSCGPGLP